MSSGIFTLFFASFESQRGTDRIVKDVYPHSAITTGPLSDRLGRKGLIVAASTDTHLASGFRAVVPWTEE
ncbi:hypothetical protein WOC76_20530 [Methylocystis sp. IM3]|uniref:hypothetical protein n=1 Tax=unclassified Methylocystis TaxID=2625913 RepID=UPI0030F9B352